MPHPDCICAQPDSFNVRPSDLRNPRCPVHGIPIVDSEKATRKELESCISESMSEVIIGFHRYKVIEEPFGITDIARNLLARYDIRRK